MTPTHKRAISTKNAPSPAGPYSQGVVIDDLLFTAGFGPQDPATGSLPEGVAAQTRSVLRNIAAVLEAQDATFDDVVKTTVHLADLKDFAEFNVVYGEFFVEPFPVRTTVGSQLAGILVEIDVVARINQR